MTGPGDGVMLQTSTLGLFLRSLFILSAHRGPPESGLLPRGDRTKSGEVGSGCAPNPVPPAQSRQRSVWAVVQHCGHAGNSGALRLVLKRRVLLSTGRLKRASLSSARSLEAPGRLNRHAAGNQSLAPTETPPPSPSITSNHPRVSPSNTTPYF
ncbi:hypothetical protein AAFF_G00205330 [Aldrovandia affinis]|uniref:Uncharacterized protein n=1 Tax=Aldrovandia affinis TaxID=143900 RepID=A0AAD7RHY5_9TELE|nr:hypothetical protein AAFF_G00205330 [Aldrovandia affinis]